MFTLNKQRALIGVTLRSYIRLFILINKLLIDEKLNNALKIIYLASTTEPDDKGFMS